jgi:integrase/recombinase XerD
MKKTNDFPLYLTSFFSQYLPGEKNMSINTIASYRDTFRILFLFCEKVKGISINKITLSHFTKEFILEFLDWLETERNCSIVTRNQRLYSLHGFIRYIQSRSPENLFEFTRILATSAKRTAKTIVSYLTEQELEILFLQPNIRTKQGRRDLVLLVLLYDTAARVQELVDIRVKDVRLVSPSIITLHGKGDKYRQVPIMNKTKNLLERYLEDHGKYNWGIAHGDAPLFFNQQHQKLSRWGVSYTLNKYVKLARNDNRFNVNFPVTPHVIRHAKAMGMVKADIPLLYIRDFLGHSHVSTTEVYARADNEKKRIALESTYSNQFPDNFPKWEDDNDLMKWLKHLC